MKLKFCGAAQNVTGSRHLIETNGKKILLDCGMFQGSIPLLPNGRTRKEKIRDLNGNFLFDPKEVDYVILSHAHIDHTGVLPRLVKLGFRGKIFCTQATKELADALLRDSAHIQIQDADFVKRHLKKEIQPLYTEEDVEKAMKLFVTFEYFQKFKLTEGVWATFYDAGHVLGSAITALDIKEKRKNCRLVYTGDLGRKYMPILNDPYQVDHADILIIESTYASHLHDSFDNVHKELEWIVNDAVNRGGKIIIPGFSFERTQELVYVFHELYERKRIPRIPIFVDSPLSARISQVFDKFKNYYDNETFRDFVSKEKSPFYFKEVKYTETIEESKGINDFQGSCIIIAASGMCEFGRIKHHLKNYMTDSKNLILAVGFMARGTRGRQILEGRPKIRIFGEKYPLRADVVMINAFSAHADKLELLEYIKNINDLEQIFIVHGEETECAVLRDNIYNILKLKCRIDIVDLGEEFEIDGGVQSKMGERRQKYLEEMEALKLKV